MGSTIKRRKRAPASSECIPKKSAIAAWSLKLMNWTNLIKVSPKAASKLRNIRDELRLEGCDGFLDRSMGLQKKYGLWQTAADPQGWPFVSSLVDPPSGLAPK